MNGRFLLDTNIIIAIFAGDGSVLKRLTEVNEVFVPAIAIGELLYGALKSGRPKENTERIAELALSTTVLELNADTAQHYAEIKSDLRSKGRPIPENDIWIAAVAVQNGLTLVTRDRHFAEVSELMTESWRSGNGI